MRLVFCVGSVLGLAERRLPRFRCNDRIERTLADELNPTFN